MTHSHILYTTVGGSFGSVKRLPSFGTGLSGTGTGLVLVREIWESQVQSLKWWDTDDTEFCKSSEGIKQTPNNTHTQTLTQKPLSSHMFFFIDFSGENPLT